MHLFKRDRRLSTVIASVEASYDRTVERLGQWMDDKERALYEKKLNRDAIKMRKRIAYACEVAKRAAELVDG